MRRLGVLAVLALVSGGVIVAVNSLTDDGADGQAPTTTVASAAVATVAGAAVTTVAPATVPASPAERTGPPTADDPARILIVGDSDAGTFAPYLEQLLDDTDVVDITLDYKTSSGLARPDFYDWPSELSRAIADTNPDIVVATFGGNDSQGLTAPCRNGAGTCAPDFIIGDPSSNEAEWTDEYARRAGEIIDMVIDSGARLVWVGIPNDDNPEVTADLAVQNAAVKKAIAARDGAIFIDTWKRFAGRSGNWAELVVDPRDGKAKPVRRDDGFHLNTDGAEILAIDIAHRVEDILKDMGADL